MDNCNFNSLFTTNPAKVGFKSVIALKENEFLQMINKHTGIIHKILYVYVDDPEDKKDLKQEILLQAWRSVHNFKGNSSFSTWLYRVALNTALTYRKKDKNKQKTSLENIDLVEEKELRSDNADRLLRAIKKLSDIDKTLITLHLEDYSNPEIADIMGLSKNNVGVKLHRIKDLLTKKLTENG